MRRRDVRVCAGFSDAGMMIYALARAAASEKRQGTKSRWVMWRLCRAALCGFGLWLVREGFGWQRLPGSVGGRAR
jgi:hypothetical protein